jgi:protein-S-isoprenylcysteine O-methyltransferase Ste14
MRAHLLATFRVLAFAGTLILWSWVLRQTFPPAVDAACILGTLLLVPPISWAGRHLLDIDPTTQRTVAVTSFVHAVLMVLFGTAVVRAIVTAASWRGVELAAPRPLALALTWATGIAMLATVANLALRGLGAPFAIALSRRLATSWLYSRTRNPMVLTILAWLTAVGLLQRSALFVVWVVAAVAPAWIVFLKVYEERELEIRFGAAYREYRAATPFLWPGTARRARRRRPASRRPACARVITHAHATATTRRATWRQR